MYGWKFEYILNKFTFSQIKRLYDYGWKYDFTRRGYKVNYETVDDQQSFDELRNEYYTEEEKKLQEEFKKKAKGK